MIAVKVSKEIESVCPHFVGACVEAQVLNTNFCQPLWDEINALGEQFRKDLTTESLKHLPSIEATRHIYRLCGKDPSRYRPASEALIRRMLQGKQLYQIDTLVDLINLASITYGYSIGGFDADKFQGDTLTHWASGARVNRTRESDAASSTSTDYRSIVTKWAAWVLQQATTSAQK